MIVFRCLVLLTFVSLLKLATGAKILFLTCTPAPSHQKPFQAIWKALSLRGHEVHVLTPNPLNDAKLTNLTEYDLSDYYELIKTYSDEKKKYFLHKPTFISAFIKEIIVAQYVSEWFNRTLYHPEVSRLLKSNTHFDVVIVEWMFPTLGALGAYYKAPIIGVTSLGAPITILDTLGNPLHPIVAPDMNLPFKHELNFKEKLLSTLYSVFARVFFYLVVLPQEDRNIQAALGRNVPYIGDICRNISVLLMNRNPVFHRIVPLFPNTIDLGTITIPPVHSPMEPELKKFIENSKNGVIYFSLGSTMKSINLDRHLMSALQNVFRGLPYDVIWKWENNSMEGKPDNVFIRKWIPQTTVLGHPNVRLFITQGGLQSTEEAIASHKPIVGLPLYFDQTTNMDTCVRYGMGKMIEIEDFSEEKLKDYILEVINNPSYAENAKKLDELMKDQPQDGLDKAIWWVEYVIRHKGAKHLRNVVVDLPWWEDYLLDILGFLVAVSLSIIFGWYIAIKLLLKLIRNRLNKSRSNRKVIKKKKI